MKKPSLAHRHAACAGVLLVLVIGAGPVHAQPAERVSLAPPNGLASGIPLTRSVLRRELATEMKLTYETTGTAARRARLRVAVYRDGSLVKQHESTSFALRKGTLPLPADALPGDGWFPEGAAFGGFFDWLSEMIWGPVTGSDDRSGDDATGDEYVPPPKKKPEDLMTHGLQSAPIPPGATVLVLAVVPEAPPAGVSSEVGGLTLVLNTR